MDELSDFVALCNDLCHSIWILPLILCDNFIYLLYASSDLFHYFSETCFCTKIETTHQFEIKTA